MKDKRNNFFGKRTLSNLIVVCTGVVLYLLLSNFTSVRGAIGTLLDICSPFIIGIAIAYLLNIPMRFFEKKVFARFKRKRGLATLTTYLLSLLVLVLLLSSVIPQLVDSIVTLGSNASTYLGNLNAVVRDLGQHFELSTDTIDGLMLSYTDLVNEIMKWVRDMLPDLVNVTLRLGSGIVGALTAIIASIYMLLSKEKLLRQCKRVLYAVLRPRLANRVTHIGKMANTVFAGFISGKVIDSAIIGAICFVFMTLMNILSSTFGIPAIRMPYSLLISIIIGVTNVIPFFGPFLGAIPSIMILLMVNPWSAVWFTLFIIVLQQFDGNFLGPKILGDSTGLPAIWVLISIIIGGGLFGFAGMLLGVPTTAVLYTLASDIIENRLRKKGLEQEPELVSRSAAQIADETTAGASPAANAAAAPPEENDNDTNN